VKEDVFWEILDEILGFGEFVAAVPNEGASANIVGKISIGKDGREKVIDKDSCHCHVHLKPEKINRFCFTFIDAGFGKEPCCELLTPQDDIVLRLYLREDKETAKEKFAEFIYEDSLFVKGSW
jgi:putative heme iron utilization protein